VPDISILQPTVLRGGVEKFKAPEKLTMLNMVPKVSHPFPSVQWEVLQGARAIADLNVPNSEANIVPQRGRAQQSASFAYIREKKNFTPTTVLWMRKVAESTGDLAVLQNAEQHIARELQDLSVRADNRAEWMLWQALSGNLSYDDAKTGVVIDVDYKYQASHKPTVTAAWSGASVDQIVDDIRTWKTLIRRDGMVDPKDVFTSEKTFTYITQAFTAAGADAHYGGLLTDRMRESSSVQDPSSPASWDSTGTSRRAPTTTLVPHTAPLSSSTHRLSRPSSMRTLSSWVTSPPVVQSSSSLAQPLTSRLHATTLVSS